MTVITEGAREISHRRVLKIAVPVVLSNATVPLLGMVDTGVIGQMGAAAPIGAVGLGAVVLSSLYWVFGFLRMGTTGLVAQAQGAGDRAEVSAGLIRALLIAATAGLILIALQWPLFHLAFRLAPASDDVEALTHAYLSTRIWGAPATIGLYALTGWLIAVERTRAVLVLQLAMNGLNVGLDLLFVLGFDWGVRGVAFATLISELFGLSLALWLSRGAFAHGLWRQARLFERAALRRLMQVNTDIMLRSVMLQACFTSFMFLSAGRGDLNLAANQVLLQFLQIVSFALDGFAFAAEALVGQAVGARSLRHMRRAGVLSAQWSVAGAALLALVFWGAGGGIIDLMTTSQEVRDAARVYLPWLVIAPLISVASYVLDGIFIGATMTRAMRNTMLASTVIYALSVSVLLPVWGNHALWASLMILNCARGVTMALLYPRAERGCVVSRPL